MKTSIKLLAASVAIACASGAFAQKGETVKMIRIDPLTGLLGPVGINQQKTYQFFMDKFNANNPAGVKFEMTFVDNKLSPTESLNLLKAAIDQGVRYIIQGDGSSVALAISDAVSKHNERNPGKEVLYINDSAVDPDLTNSKCSYWHFRFDADTSMKMEALSSFIADQKDVHKIYLLNQNYSHGQQVAKYAKETVKRKRPDIEFVGEDLHPLAQVRDFAPYIAKIKAAGADAVITGNWGSDLSLLVKAANEGGFTGKFFTYYVQFSGTPTALGQASNGRVFQIGTGHNNMGGQMAKWMEEFRTKYNDDLTSVNFAHVFETLTAAMAAAKSTDPVKVAAAMEGIKVKTFNGETEMRKADHQLQQPLYLGKWQKVDAKNTYDAEKTGMTLASIKEYPNYVSSTPTSCQMKRP